MMQKRDGRTDGLSPGAATAIAVMAQVATRCALRALLTGTANRDAVRRIAAEVGRGGAVALPDGPVREAILGHMAEIDDLCARPVDTLRAIEQRAVAGGRAGR